MTTSLHFKTSAKNLAAACERAGVVLDVYALLNLTDQMVTARLNFDEFPTTNPLSYSETLVMSALGSTNVMDYMRRTQKINAIKELRAITGCGLKEAKDAVEDHRVVNSSGYRPGGW